MPVETSKGTPQPINLGTDEDAGATKDYRQMCKYSTNCYQKNPMHHQKFRHPKEAADEVEVCSKVW